MRTKKELSIHDKAVRLCEGGVAEINGHFVKAVECPNDITPCEVCNMDSACRMEMTDLCAECEKVTHKRYFLRFAYIIESEEWIKKG